VCVCVSVCVCVRARVCTSARARGCAPVITTQNKEGTTNQFAPFSSIADPLQFIAVNRALVLQEPHTSL